MCHFSVMKYEILDQVRRRKEMREKFTRENLSPDNPPRPNRTKAGLGPVETKGKIKCGAECITCKLPVHKDNFLGSLCHRGKSLYSSKLAGQD